MGHLSEPPLQHIKPLSDAAPVVVGGLGGSGTRVIAELLQVCGFDIGTDLNISLDDLGFTALFKRPTLWPVSNHVEECSSALRAYLTSRGHFSGQPPDATEHQRSIANLASEITLENSWIETEELAPRWAELGRIVKAGQQWGWKEPNSHIFLPFLLHALPNMRFIFLTRDGRDMALSGNQTQLSIWGSQLLGRPLTGKGLDDALDFWTAVHQRALAIRALAPDRVCLIKFEDLFDDPGRVANQLIALTEDIDPDTVKRFVETLDRPPSIGRYRSSQNIELTKPQQDILSSLEYCV